MRSNSNKFEHISYRGVRGRATALDRRSSARALYKEDGTLYIKVQDPTDNGHIFEPSTVNRQNDRQTDKQKSLRLLCDAEW